MPVKKDEAGARSVEMMVELPGTPEELWQALATGPGYSAWFAPTEIEERHGGTVTFAFGPGMTSQGIVTTWQPPHRFGYVEKDWKADAPPCVTEVVITAKAGGTCTLRMVHSLFTDKAEWDEELEGFEKGWPGFFKVLRIYLGSFAGAPASSLRLNRAFAGSVEDGWRELTDALGVTGIAPGGRVRVRESTPPLEGTVRHIADTPGHHGATIELDAPGPGVALPDRYLWAGHVMLSLCFYFYGPGAASLREKEEAFWEGWFAKHFGKADPALA